MALNEMIAQGAQFKMPDPLEQYGRIAQIQQAQNQNALAQYQISSAQRADETNTNFLGALRAAGNDPMKIQQAYINAGKGKEASEYATSLLTQQKARGDILKQQRDNFSSDLLDLSGNPTDEKIKLLAKNIAADPNLPPAFQTVAVSTWKRSAACSARCNQSASSTSAAPAQHAIYFARMGLATCAGSCRYLVFTCACYLSLPPARSAPDDQHAALHDRFATVKL